VSKDHAANERTFLAWVRTGIALMAFGFVIVKFNLFLLTVATATSLDAGRQLQVERLSGPLGRYDGLAFIFVGYCSCCGRSRALRPHGLLLDDPELHSAGSLRTELILSIVLAFLAAALSTSCSAEVPAGQACSTSTWSTAFCRYRWGRRLAEIW